MAPSHSTLIAALHRLSESNRALRLRLEENEDLIRQALTMLSEGATAVDGLEKISIYDAQQAADAAMTRLFDARHQLRKVVVCDAVEGGMSVEQLATMFHVRPDLISSYVAEGANRFLAGFP
jgi:hypothetical protein